MSASAESGGPCLLPGMASPSPWLVLAIVLLSAAAGLELTAASAAIRAAVAWSPRLAGSVTVAVGGGGLESPEAAAARAAEILARAPGLTKIALLDPDPADGPAGNLMGVPKASGGAGRGGPPRLIAVTATDGSRASAATVRQALRRERIIAAVDDHGAWTGPLERTAILAAASAAGLLFVVVALTWALSAASAGAAVRGRASRISLLLHLGATDGMILWPLRARIVGGAALGALIGLAAAVTLAATGHGVGSPMSGLIAAPAAVDVWDLAAAAIWLPIVVLVAAWAAGGGAAARLRALA